MSLQTRRQISVRNEWPGPGNIEICFLRQVKRSGKQKNMQLRLIRLELKRKFKINQNQGFDYN